MSISLEDAEHRIQEHRPISGWVKTEDGSFVGEGGFPSNNLYPTPEFVKSSERINASWGFFNYAGVIFRQVLKRNKSSQDE